MKAMRWLSSLLAGLFFLAAPSLAPAQEDSKAKDDRQDTSKVEQEVPTYTLPEASKKGLVSVSARGTGDGRMTVSVKNQTNRPLRVVLPPGIVAQSATGQFGGMGGMGGGMGGMGMGGMGMGMMNVSVVP